MLNFTDFDTCDNCHSEEATSVTSEDICSKQTSLWVIIHLVVQF